MDAKEYITFKKNFWDWFDSLPQKEKEKFWEYHTDTAETFFYFKYYQNKNG